MLNGSTRRWAVPVAVGGTLLAAAGAAAGVALSGGRASGPAAVRAPAAPVPPVLVSVVGDRGGTVPWDRPLSVSVTDGRLVAVHAQAATGSPVAGTVDVARNGWTSATTLVPLTGYTLTVSYTNAAHRVATTVDRVTSTDATSHLEAVLSPGDGDVVGVASPLIVTFNHPVSDAYRAAVAGRLSVTTNPAVTGAWHWMSDQEVHWRPEHYWTPGTSVRLASDLTGLDVGGGVWGRGVHSTAFRIGASHVSVADVAGHVMRVYDNGSLIRTLPISAGRDKYPTKGGVHITLEKSYLVVMDSATVGIPRNSPDGYYEKVYWDVRISYGGAFVHAAPWSVADQGHSNVSHGCINLSPANAQWFYGFSQRGDVVDIVNTDAGPDVSDPGMADWNISWAQWLAGSAT